NLTLAAPVEVSTPTPQIVLTGKVDADTRPDIITVSGGLRSLTTVATVSNTSICASDFNQDGFVTGDDFDEFSAAFDAGDPSADVNHDGFTTGDDFDYFAQRFDVGC